MARRPVSATLLPIRDCDLREEGVSDRVIISTFHQQNQFRTQHIEAVRARATATCQLSTSTRLASGLSSLAIRLSTSIFGSTNRFGPELDYEDNQRLSTVCLPSHTYVLAQIIARMPDKSTLSSGIRIDTASLCNAAIVPYRHSCLLSTATYLHFSRRVGVPRSYATPSLRPATTGSEELSARSSH